MKTFIFIAVIAFAAAEPDFYHFLENLDLDLLLKNRDQLEKFVDCVLDQGPCNELYEPYKDLFSAAVKEKCNKCTPYQKHLFEQFLEKVKTKLPIHYANFIFKFDPENKYFDDLMLELQHRGIAI